MRRFRFLGAGLLDGWKNRRPSPGRKPVGDFHVLGDTEGDTKRGTGKLQPFISGPAGRRVPCVLTARPAPLPDGAPDGRARAPAVLRFLKTSSPSTCPPRPCANEQADENESTSAKSLAQRSSTKMSSANWQAKWLR